MTHALFLPESNNFRRLYIFIDPSSFSIHAYKISSSDLSRNDGAVQGNGQWKIVIFIRRDSNTKKNAGNFYYWASSRDYSESTSVS